MKPKEHTDKDALQSVKNWYAERYETTLTQRNWMVVLTAIAIVVVGICVLGIRYVKSTRSIEPFVIEIERKTGVPTVVDPVSAIAYSAQDSVKRYFVMKYIRSREEYYPTSFDLNYNTVVRVLSSDQVYNSDYRPKFNPNNPTSPATIYGKVGYRKVNLKSLVFLKDNQAQARVAFESQGQLGPVVTDKVVYVDFTFENKKMTDEDRLINPLGFTVVSYRIEDERGG